MKVILDRPAVVRYTIGTHGLDIYCINGKIALASWQGQEKGTLAELRGQPVPAPNLASAGVCEDAAFWIEQYFSGGDPPRVSLDWFSLPKCASSFRIDVWSALLRVPYGTAVTYLDIAKSIGRNAESARSVAGAIGDNPFSPFIPCHRVIGSDGSLTGFAAGLEIKKMLLGIERVKAPDEFCQTAREKFFREVNRR